MDSMQTGICVDYASEGEKIMAKFKLTRDEAAYLAREVTGQGGWQSLLRILQKKMMEIELSEAEIAKVRAYAAKGQGGFQTRLNKLIAAINRGS
jgi:hypothetical protein